MQPISGRLNGASATEAVDSGSIPYLVKSKTIPYLSIWSNQIKDYSLSGQNKDYGSGILSFPA